MSSGEWATVLVIGTSRRQRHIPTGPGDRAAGAPHSQRGAEAAAGRSGHGSPEVWGTSCPILVTHRKTGQPPAQCTWRMLADALERRAGDSEHTPVPVLRDPVLEGTRPL